MRFFTDSDIRALLRPVEAVDAIEAAFRRDYKSTVVMPVRTRAEVPGRGVLLSMPCYDSALPALGIKVVTFYDHGAAAERLHATSLLMEPETGKLLALMEANYLTELRTAATSAVATRHMARSDSKVLSVFGTGQQARAHIEVLAADRAYQRILLCGSSEERTRRFADEWSSELRLPIEAADARSCAAESDVLCTCTTSSTPIFDGCWLHAGTHLNLVGAFRPDTREVDSETVRRARVVVETYESALAEAGDLLIPMCEGVIGSDHIIADLHEITSAKKRGRETADEITLFETLGCALEDLVMAKLAYNKARQEMND